MWIAVSAISYVQSVAVGVGIDGNGLDAHASRGLDDAARDFATIGDENPLEHRNPRRGEPALPALRRTGANVNSTLGRSRRSDVGNGRG